MSGFYLAMLEIKIVLATMLQRYRWRYGFGARIDRNVKITMSPRQGSAHGRSCPAPHCYGAEVREYYPRDGGITLIGLRRE
ncbi:MAG: hypothetical protein U0074_02670 [Kouleothrix sp.]